MKKYFIFAFAFLLANPAHAFWGVGDITFDPTSYGEISALYKKTIEMYENAKKQLDGLASIEKSIKDAQASYDTLANTDLKQVAAGLRPDSNNTKTAAGLRAELARMEGGADQNAGYIRYQLARIQQLENLELLKKVSASNTSQSTGNINQATKESITAQSTATLAALAAAEEQRRVQDDYARAAGVQATVDNLNNSKKVYEAIGK